jgi:RimJ/RimL family protein N-acetyltransferase
VEICLTPFGEQHYALLSSWFADQREIAQWGGSGLNHPLSPLDFEVMIRAGAGDLPERLCWMAEAEDRKIVGHIQLVFDWLNGVARIARVAVAPEHRGRGFAVSIVDAVLLRAFEHHAMERVELNVFSWNAKAIHAYSKAGFLIEGVRRSSAKVGDERWDTTIMGMLRKEWLRRSVKGARISSSIVP